MHIVIGLFDEIEKGRVAVERLQALGLTEQHMLMLTQQDASHADELLETEPETAAGQGALIGTAIGGILGLLGGVTVIPLVGLGSILASGLMGATSGVTIGSYLGAIYGTRAETYEGDSIKDTLAAGGLLVIADGDMETISQDQIQEAILASEPQLVDVVELQHDSLTDLAHQHTGDGNE